ncbi:DUF4097 family beta strand repeat-containing protein [Streptomyces sp. NPDC003717]|uniref:DUF4097 family beta strand repeat-containing protein n=1 Tax=Streptomyces sp. NPDC003717 TaxID=3154276 RepID=UPI0033B6531D
MTARTRTARVLGAAAVTALLVTALGACADAEDDKEPDHRAFTLPGASLTVDSDDSALEIVSVDGGKPGRIEVTRWFHGRVTLGGDPKVSWTMDGDRLKLRVHCNGLIADCSAKHRIEVPRGTAVTVRGDDGSVSARGFRDALSIRTEDGSVHVSDSSGPLDLRSDDGSVHADVDSRRVSAHTADGSVRLGLGTVPDRVEAGSDDGSVTVTVPRATYKVSTKSEDGGVDVSVPRDDTSAHVVDVETKDGGITVRTAN